MGGKRKLRGQTKSEWSDWFNNYIRSKIINLRHFLLNLV
jgi:hypothetical protein